MSAPPGITDLLAAPNMKPADKARAASNALIPVLAGISAMGDWMSQDESHVGLHEGTVSDTGYLLTFLADLALQLHHIEHAQGEAVTSDAQEDEYVDIPVYRRAAAGEDQT